MSRGVAGLGQVFLLASAQALFQTASVLVMTVGGVAGAVVASRAELATLPVAAMFLGTALCTIPASLWMARAGRRAGFLLGASLGLAGGVVAALGMLHKSLLLLSLGTLLVGAYQAFAQFYRFAAAEVASPIFRPKAISLVLAGGVLAALLGPWLGRAGAGLLNTEYTGSFAFLAGTSLLALLVLLGVPATLVPILILGARVRRLSRDGQDRLAEVSAHVDEAIHEIRTVQAYGHEDADRATFARYAEAAYRVGVQRIGHKAWLIASVMLIAFSAVGIILWIGGHDVLAGRLSAGELSAFVFYAAVVAGGAGAVSEVWGELQRAAGAAGPADQARR